MSAKSKNLEAKIIGYGQKRQLDDLEKLIIEIEESQLNKLMIDRLGRADSITLWNYILMGLFSCDDAVDKRFNIVMSVLKKLAHVELSIKQSFEIVTRLFTYLPLFTTPQLIEMCEFCVESIRGGDPKFIGWKDLLPEIMTILLNLDSFDVNGIESTGEEYRANLVKNLYSMKWAKPLLTPLAIMFKDLTITSDERNTILVKFCHSLQKMEPLELPPLSFQLFSLCTSSSLVLIPIMAFEKYFHKHYYKKMYIEMHSDTTDFDSIDNHSEKEFREAEETILFHLGGCTEYRMTETDISNVFKGLASTPNSILTPFIISAMLTMCNVNRYPETTRLSSSIILPFIRSVIKNNEDERDMIKRSAWCRDIIASPCVDVEKILNVLIDQNRDGNDVVTPGIVGLSFILLKAKNFSAINTMGVNFLHKFLKKRFIFGQGIVKHLSEFLFADQDAAQYAECLTTLSLTNTLTVSECVDTIKSILEYFLLIPGETAMRMMSFVFPIVRISHTVRDALIDILRKAMYHKDSSTRKMGVYGFCMLLKQLRMNNSRRASGASSASMTFSQSTSISGFSMISQATLSNMDNPQRHLDILTLEIVGILRKSFNDTKDMKEILYESLTRAIEFNPIIIPNVLQFLDLHFRAYFNIEEITFEINFDMVVKETANGNVEELESLGRLITLIGHAIYLCEYNCLHYNNQIIKKLLESLVDRIDVISLEHLGILGAFDQKMNLIGSQFLNCLEALMNFCIWMAKTNTTTNYIKKCLKLFKFHQSWCENMKSLSSSKKGTKKGAAAGRKAVEDSETTIASQNRTLARQATISFKPENIWELVTLERFLKIIHDDDCQIGTMEERIPMQKNTEFGQYVLQVAIIKIVNLEHEPEYKHVAHSRHIFNLLSQMSGLLFKNCLSRLEDLCANYDAVTGQLSVECFHKILFVINELYKRKINDFFKITVAKNGQTEIATENCYNIITVIQSLLERCVIENNDLDNEKITTRLLECLEILYEYIPGDNQHARNIYNWLYKFCEGHKIEHKHFHLINKLLFEQRVKTQTGPFFNSIAIQIQKEIGQIEEEVFTPEFKIKSVNHFTAESCTNYLCAILKEEIENAEYFVTKVKSYFLRYKISGSSSTNAQEYLHSMKSIERSICSQLIHVSKTLIPLTNSQLSPGTCTNNLIKVVTQLYICITNLTKHFLARHAMVPVVYHASKFDQLVKSAGKPLAVKIYAMITYIDENILPDDHEGNAKTSKNPNANKIKVIAGTKFLPRLILCLENFNKFILNLGKKTKNDISSYLHIGTVRDFRIKTSDLKEAITKHSNTEEQDDEAELLDENTADDEEMNEVDDEPVTQPNPTSVLLQNIAKINKTAKKSREKEIVLPKVHEDVVDTGNEGKGKKGRKRKTDEIETGENEPKPKANRTSTRAKKGELKK